MIKFSFLMPTRNRPDLVRRFFQSLADTTAFPEFIEVVLAADEDDMESQAITEHRFRLTRVVTPKGANMGELNRACYQASKGRYVCLINDDVIVRTRAWDRAVYNVFARFDDDVALIHTNDLMFEEKLCTFPILSRIACDAIGVCPAQYRRYRIDDHIYDTYNMLAHIGHKRIFYLPDVIFEHDNYAHQGGRAGGHVGGNDKRVYVPKQEIIKLDAVDFDKTFDRRKSDALKLAHIIEERTTHLAEERVKASLATVRDSHGYRRPEFVQRLGPAALAGNGQAIGRVTIGVVTSGIEKPHAKKCLEAIKEHTSDYDLVILDNNNGKGFNHPREMNRILSVTRTDYLVLMDDDVFVESGWLDGLKKGFAFDKDAGVVVPLHKDKDNVLSYAGVYFMGNEYGMHAHLTQAPEAVREIQSLCSAIMMINIPACGHVRVDERYNKYFLDIDYGLRIWEAGFKVLVSPHSSATHLGGATLSYGTTESQRLWNADMRTFVNDWTKTGRIAAVEAIWARYPELKLLGIIPGRIKKLFDQGTPTTWEFARFRDEVEALRVITGRYPLFASLLKTGLEEHVERCAETDDKLKAEFCEKMLQAMSNVRFVNPGFAPILIGSRKGYNLVEFEESVYGVPLSLGALDLAKKNDRAKPGIITARTQEQVIINIDEASGETFDAPQEAAPTLECSHNGYNVASLGGVFYAIPLDLGRVDLLNASDRSKPGIITAFSVQEARSMIDKAPAKPSMQVIEAPFLSASAPLLLDSYKGYNIVSWKDAFFGIPLYLGDVDLSDAKARSHKDVLTADSRRRVDAAIDDRVPSAQNPTASGASPTLVEEGYKGFNIIYCGGRYFALPQGEGSFDMERVLDKRYSVMFSAGTHDDARRRINRAIVPLAFMRLKRGIKRLVGDSKTP
ncbi:MAG: glycosyltransferase [Deltaproteobacteria bacterium]|nr:glycosyltransferase [Deltaproteobacteria bacterium]